MVIKPAVEEGPALNSINPIMSEPGYFQFSNKTGTSQVGAIFKAQKAQNIFFGKKLEIFEKKLSFGNCRTVPKNVKGGPFLIYKQAFCCKITKNSKRGPFGDIEKFSKKSRTVPK